MPGSFDNVPAGLMTLSEASKRLRLSRQAVWAYAQAGLLEPRQFRVPGGQRARRLLTCASVEAWIRGASSYAGLPQPLPAPTTANTGKE